MAAFRGYANLERYQYHDFTKKPLQYSHVPLYDRPPEHPVFEPPTDHPVEKEESQVAEDKEQPPHPESIDSATGIFSAPLLGEVQLMKNFRWQLREYS